MFCDKQEKMKARDDNFIGFWNNFKQGMDYKVTFKYFFAKDNNFGIIFLSNQGRIIFQLLKQFSNQGRSFKFFKKYLIFQIY